MMCSFFIQSSFYFYSNKKLQYICVCMHVLGKILGRKNCIWNGNATTSDHTDHNDSDRVLFRKTSHANLLPSSSNQTKPPIQPSILMKLTCMLTIHLHSTNNSIYFLQEYKRCIQKPNIIRKRLEERHVSHFPLLFAL